MRKNKGEKKKPKYSVRLKRPKNLDAVLCGCENIPFLDNKFLWLSRKNEPLIFLEKVIVSAPIPRVLLICNATKILIWFYFILLLNPNGVPKQQNQIQRVPLRVPTGAALQRHKQKLCLVRGEVVDFHWRRYRLLRRLLSWNLICIWLHQEVQPIAGCLLGGHARHAFELVGLLFLLEVYEAWWWQNYLV